MSRVCAWVEERLTVQRWILLILVLFTKLLREDLHAALHAVIAGASSLVVEVAQRVPLRGALRVELDLARVSWVSQLYDHDTDLIIKAMAWDWRVHEAEHLVYQAFAEEPRRFDCADGPAVELVQPLDELHTRGTYFNDTETPSLTSAAAALTTSGVKRFSVP